MTASSGLIRDLSGIVGEAAIVSSPADAEKYERGYRYGSGHALAIARPATVAELSALVRYCFAHDLRILPQGANTGLVGASSPDESGGQLVVSLERLRGVESIDVHNRTASARAGLDGVLDSLRTTQHLVEMLRRTLPDGAPRRCFDRLSNRLSKILAVARKLGTPE